MNILVTGGAGFVGSNLLKKLRESGANLYCIDNYSVVEKGNEIKGVTYIDADVATIAHLDLPHFDYIYHLAALARIQPSFGDPLKTVDNNSFGTLAVLEYARNNPPKKLIYSGSSSKWHNPEISPYAMSKKIGEDMLKMYRTVYGLNLDIARFYNVYGAGEILEGEWAAVIGKWRGLIDKGLPITIVGDGEQRRTFTHIDDIIDGLIRIAKYPKYHIDAWELGCNTNYSLNEVAEMFRRRYPKLKVEYIPQQQGNYRETKRENLDATKILGWDARDRLEEYIKSL